MNQLKQIELRIYSDQLNELIMDFLSIRRSQIGEGGGMWML